MICASCGRETTEQSCEQCGEDALLDGRYRLDEIVGRGAAGTTYRATRVEDDAVFAVKELDFRRIDSFKTQTLFEREAAVLEQLDHPGIPQYVDNFIFGDGKHLSFCLVQEFIEGHTLDDETTKTRYDEREALELLDELLEIATYLHSRQPPVIHRDIKPKNVMRRASDDSLVIIDFGSVREVLEDPEAGGSTIAGTFGFMAPEQFQGVAMPATDVYGLGALTVALLSRKRPQEMLDLTNRLHWKPHVNVSPSTTRLLERMLEPVYHDRISDAAQARRELGRVFDVLDGRAEMVEERRPAETADAPSYPPEEPVDPRETSSAAPRRTLIVSAAAFVLLTSGVFVALMGDDSHVAPRSVAPPPSWQQGLDTVTPRTVGEIGHLSLSDDAEQLRSMGRAQGDEDHRLVVPTVVARQATDCEVDITGDKVSSIRCPLQLDWNAKGPPGVKLTMDYFSAKYGEPAEVLHGGGRDTEKSVWVWRGDGVEMRFRVPQPGRTGPSAASVVVQRLVGPPSKPESGGRDPFEPGTDIVDEK